MTLRIVVLSDLHLGSDDSVLGLAAARRFGKPHSEYLDEVLFSKLSRLVNPVQDGTKRMLVLAGDTLDFSLQSYASAFSDGQSFFKSLSERGLFDEIVLIAGNHDHNIWQMVQQEVRVIGQLRKGRIPKPFEHTRGALLDLEAGELVIPGVTDGPAARSDSFFIQGLFGDTQDRPKLWVVYPNLFIQPAVGDAEEATPILVTHGHFFSLPWILLTSIFPRNLGVHRRCTLEQLEQLNSPLTEMAWTALGQAGNLSEAASRIITAMAKGDAEPARKVIDELGDYLDYDVWKAGPWNPKEWATDALVGAIEGVLLYLIERGLASSGEHKANETFLDDEDNQMRIETYLALSRDQYGDMLRSCDRGWRAGAPRTVVFGHTHLVIEPPRGLPGRLPGTTFINTGGFMKDVSRVEATAVVLTAGGDPECIRVWP